MLMRIITINLPISYLKMMDGLLDRRVAKKDVNGEKYTKKVLEDQQGIYPSRSELIRVATREFLIKELEALQSFTQYQPQVFNEKDEGEADPLGLN
jgi:Arc/MetJ-type ribon-helix-helix transcriptional regulator